MKLLRGIETDLPDLYFQTQQSERKEGGGSIRPDMWGFDGPVRRVFVENKFWAGLTENQPLEYLRELARSTQPTVLLFVVPEDRKHAVWRELRTRLEEAGVSLTDRETAAVVFSADTGHGPILALTSWPRLLSSLERELEAPEDRRAIGDLVQLQALCDAADTDDYLRVSVEETSNQRTPAFILQMGTIVREAVELAAIEGIVGLKGFTDGNTRTRTGRYFGLPGEGGVDTWIGTDFELWKRHGGTPMWLVWFANYKEARSTEVGHILEPWAAKEGFLSSSVDGDFALGLRLGTSGERDLVVRSIVDDLKRVATALSGLPPIPSCAGPSDE